MGSGLFTGRLAFSEIAGGSRHSDIGTGKVVAKLRSAPSSKKYAADAAMWLVNNSHVVTVTQGPNSDHKNSVRGDVKEDESSFTVLIGGSGTIYVNGSRHYYYLFGVKFDKKSGHVTLVSCSDAEWAEYEKEHKGR